MEIYIVIGLLVMITALFVSRKIEEKRLKDDMDIYSYHRPNTASDKNKKTRIDKEEYYIIESNEEITRTRDGEHVLVDFSVNVRGNGNHSPYRIQCHLLK